MADYSDLGTFRLGHSTLGNSYGRIEFYENIGMSEQIDANVSTTLNESLAMAELLEANISTVLAEAIAIAESAYYPTYTPAGIIGRIVTLLDITSDDFCAAVLEAGQSLEINDVPGRAFFQIQQYVRRYDREIETEPGDGIMYACPDLETEDAITGESRPIQVGDVVKYQWTNYTIVAIIDRDFDGNVIYRECACKLEAVAPAAPTGVR